MGKIDVGPIAKLYRPLGRLESTLKKQKEDWRPPSIENLGRLER